MTTWSEEFKARYGFGGWDDPRTTDKCLHCKGTGMSDAHNECGFCFPADDNYWNKENK